MPTYYIPFLIQLQSFWYSASGLFPLALLLRAGRNMMLMSWIDIIYLFTHSLYHNKWFSFCRHFSFCLILQLTRHNNWSGLLHDQRWTSTYSTFPTFHWFWMLMVNLKTVDNNFNMHNIKCVECMISVELIMHVHFHVSYFGDKRCDTFSILFSFSSLKATL